MNGWRGQKYTGQSIDVHYRKIGQASNIYYGNEVQPPVSTVLWCDKNNHPFSAKDKEKRHFVDTHEVEVLTGNSYGRPTYQDRQEVTEEIDICGPCWREENPFQAREPDAIEMAEAEAEEADAAMWKAKYEALEARNQR
jgi:hypothetical protein